MTLDEQAMQLKQNGEDAYIQGKYNQAKSSFEDALTIFEQCKDEKNLISSIISIGECEEYMGLLQNAIEQYTKAIQLTDNNLYSYERAYAFSALGSVKDTLEEYEQAEQYYLEALKLTENEPNNIVRARTFNRLAWLHKCKGSYTKAEQMYQQAIALYQHIPYPIDMANTINNLGELYTVIGDLGQSEKYYLQAIELYKSSEAPLDSADTLQNLAEIYLSQNKKELSQEFMLKALRLYEDSDHPFEVKKSLERLLLIDEKRTLLEATKSPLGIIWLVSYVGEQLSSGKIISEIFWQATSFGVNEWWETIVQLQTSQTYEGSIFTKNWRVIQVLDTMSRTIISETFFNKLVGVNDIEYNHSDTSSLRDEQRDLPPLWIVEFPIQVFHEQQYLKIRLNNLVTDTKNINPIPSIDHRFSQIKRIKLDLETQWFQEYSVDHIFYPNTLVEHEQYEKKPEETWLSDVITINLVDNLKQHDLIDISYSLKIYFSLETEIPDIVTITKRITIPILRSKNIQKLEKIQLQNANSLAVILAISSVIISLSSDLVFNFEQITAIIDHIGRKTVFTTVASIFSIGLLCFYWLYWKNINVLKHTMRENFVQKFRNPPKN